MLSLNLWCTPNGPIIDEARRILVHPQMNQTGVVIKPKIGLSYDTGVAKALSRHRGKFAADTPDRPDAATAVLELDYYRSNRVLPQTG